MPNILEIRPAGFTHYALSRLAEMDSEWMKCALDAAKLVDIESGDDFAFFVKTVVPKLGTNQDVARQISVSAASLSRWASGKALPPLYARGAIVSQLEKLMNNYIKNC